MAREKASLPVLFLRFKSRKRPHALLLKNHRTTGSFYRLRAVIVTNGLAVAKEVKYYAYFIFSGKSTSE